MPFYIYEVIEADGSDGEQFELYQSMADEPLKVHPENGKPIRRVLTAPNIAKRWSDGKMNASLSDKNVERLGFTKDEKTGDGTYQKRAGSGPDTLGG